MDKELQNFIFQTAERIVSISTLVATETWQQVFQRVPDSSSVNVSTGYVTVPSSSEIESVIDIQAPPAEESARLRVWIIKLHENSDGSTTSDNVQLTFHLEYALARSFVERHKTPGMAELLELISSATSTLEEIVISESFGKNNATGATNGKRVELTAGQLRQLNDTQLANLKQTVKSALDSIEGSAKTQ